MISEKELERIDNLPLIERAEERLKHNLAVSKEDISLMIEYLRVFKKHPTDIDVDEYNFKNSL